MKSVRLKATVTVEYDYFPSRDTDTPQECADQSKLGWENDLKEEFGDKSSILNIVVIPSDDNPKH